MTKLKIGVYSIALNEEQFAERWAQSARDADYLLVGDTGSKDGTVDALKKNGVDVHSIVIKPWRFDDARNATMALLPTDLDAIIALDLDEVLRPDWRAKMEDNWVEGCNRFRYKYIWSWFNNDTPEVVYYGDKISGRHTHRWCHPVHEVLKPTRPESMHFLHDFLIEHHPDHSKPRSQYLPLLEMAVQEMPQDDRNSHYLGREYYYYSQFDNAITELKRHLSLPNAKWNAERAASMRFIAKSYHGLGDIGQAHRWYVNATFEDPESSEAMVDAAKFELSQNRFHATIDYCERALKLAGNGGSYLNERYALSEGPYDLSSVAYYHIGMKDKAVEYCRKAVSFNPNDERLQMNLKMMEG